MDGYTRIIDAFDKDKTAGEFLREDGEGGFASGVQRMAREIDRLRAAMQMIVDHGEKADAVGIARKSLGLPDYGEFYEDN